MRKGIIMDMNERFLTLLTPDGEFLQISRQKQFYEIGQEIPIPVQEKQITSIYPFFNTIKGKSLVAATVAAVFALITFIPFNQNEVYAYMSIDVNPSIELGVNEDLEVIEVIPYNDSGEKIVEELQGWKNKELSVVTEDILASLKGNGYLKNEQEVVIGTVQIGESNEKAEMKLDEAIDDLEENISSDQAKLITYEATTKEREVAQKSGLTAGKLRAKQEKSDKEKSIQLKVNKQIQEKKASDTLNQNSSVKKQQSGVINKAPTKEIKPNNNQSQNNKNMKTDRVKEKLKEPNNGALEKKTGEYKKNVSKKAQVKKEERQSDHERNKHSGDSKNSKEKNK